MSPDSAKLTEPPKRMFFTVADVAARWGLKERMARNILVNAKHFRIPGKKRSIRLYRIADIEAFEAQNMQELFKLNPARPRGLNPKTAAADAAHGNPS